MKKLNGCIFCFFTLIFIINCDPSGDHGQSGSEMKAVITAINNTSYDLFIEFYLFAGYDNTYKAINSDKRTADSFSIIHSSYNPTGVGARMVSPPTTSCIERIVFSYMDKKEFIKEFKSEIYKDEISDLFIKEGKNIFETYFYLIISDELLE